MLRRLLILMALAILTRAAVALDDVPASQPQTVTWGSISGPQQSQVAGLLKSPHWPVRVFGLQRLERYSGTEVDQLVRERLGDKSWQVRCFAIAQMHFKGLTIDPEVLKDEKEGRVIRAALRYGVKLPPEGVQKLATRLMRARNIEDLMLGIEVAAASDIPALRDEAADRTETLVRNMDDAVAAMVSRRLGAMLQLTDVPQDRGQWKVWFTGQSELIILPAPGVESWIKAHPAKTSLVAELDDETFTNLLEYLDFLKQRDLDLVIVMDATASMIPMVNQARAGVDALILYLSDISREMRLAFVAYRDHDNEPVWDGHPFTSDITSIRKYLFNLRVTGGADLPEAVLEGLEACGHLKWNRKATRQIVLVGDAPPHEEDVYKVRALVDGMRDSGITLHAVHVPMVSPGAAARPAAGGPDRPEDTRSEYNKSTAEMFESIAEVGGGQKTEMTSAGDLVPAIMHFTIEDGWWPVFDEFYVRYLELCR